MKSVKLNTPRLSTIVTLGNGKIKYQICVLDKDEHDKPIVTATELLAADTLKQACEYANDKHNRNVCRVYPYCTKADGEAQIRLAEHTLASFEKWERRNNNAVLNPQNRNEWDREDYIMLACIAINAVLEENPHATMHELKTMAFKAIANEQKSNERKAEREYNPDFIMCNIAPKTARATIPELDRLFRLAIEQADLTEKQMSAISYTMDGHSIADVAELMGITKRPAAKIVYSAQYKILCTAVKLDKKLRIFELAGLLGDDISKIVRIIAKRADIHSKYDEYTIDECIEIIGKANFEHNEMLDMIDCNYKDGHIDYLTYHHALNAIAYFIKGLAGWRNIEKFFSTVYSACSWQSAYMAATFLDPEIYPIVKIWHGEHVDGLTYEEYVNGKY